MKEISRELAVNLPGTDLIAKIYIRRKEQQSPNDGDKIIARGSIWLPLDNPQNTSPYATLNNAIIFDKRIGVLNYFLSPTWGNNEGGYRKLGKDFIAKTWKEAFQKAEEELRSELSKLTNALENRQKALADAEN